MNLVVELSEKSIADAIKKVDAYANSLDRKCDELCRKLAEYGVDAAKVNVPVDTGALRDGISLMPNGDNEYLVISIGDYAAFVEFGTGVVGQGTYQGTIPAGYGYNQGWTPSAHDPNDPEAWYYIDREGKRRRTKGHAAQPYMAQTAEQMRQAVLRIAKEVFE